MYSKKMVTKKEREKEETEPITKQRKDFKLK